jgi:hypothetical protein
MWWCAFSYYSLQCNKMTPILDAVNRTFCILLNTEILKYKQHQPTTDTNTNTNTYTLLVTAHSFNWSFSCQYRITCHLNVINICFMTACLTSRHFWLSILQWQKQGGASCWSDRKCNWTELDSLLQCSATGLSWTVCYNARCSVTLTSAFWQIHLCAFTVNWHA